MNSPLLGLDIGLHRTGVALSESGLLAQPTTVIEWNPAQLATHTDAIIKLVRQHEIQTLVIGLPLNEDGSPTPQSEKTEVVIAALRAGLAEAGIGVTIDTINEFQSSQDGELRFPGVERDAAAAAVILQEYLEANGGGW